MIKGFLNDIGFFLFSFFKDSLFNLAYQKFNRAQRLAFFLNEFMVYNNCFQYS